MEFERTGSRGDVMKPMAQLNRAPQHRAPLIAMRSSAVRARIRAVGIVGSRFRVSFGGQLVSLIWFRCEKFLAIWGRALFQPCPPAPACAGLCGRASSPARCGMRDSSADAMRMSLFVFRARARVCGVSGASRARRTHVHIACICSMLYVHIACIYSMLYVHTACICSMHVRAAQHNRRTRFPGMCGAQRFRRLRPVPAVAASRPRNCNVAGGLHACSKACLYP